MVGGIRINKTGIGKKIKSKGRTLR